MQETENVNLKKYFKNYDITFPYLESTFIIEPPLTNAVLNAHGGELVKLMDNTSGICAFRHAKGAVVTARIDDISYIKPVKLNDVAMVRAQICYAGSTSILISTKIFINDIENPENYTLAVSALFTFVHIKDGKPSPVEKLVPKTEMDKVIYDFGKSKYEAIKNRIKESKLEKYPLI